MRALLIDDHPIFRRGLALTLTSLDPKAVIEHCVNLQGLQAALGRFGSEPCQLAMLDLYMPGFKACEALAYFRDLAPDVPVVVVSGDEDPGTVRKCIDMGACGYVPKSVDPQVLTDAMERLLRGGVWLPGSSLGIVAPETWPAVRSPRGWAGRLPITARQRDVLQRVVQGKTNKAIGRELGISDGTVKTHLAHLMAMLGVNTRTQIIYELARQGIRVEDIALSEERTAGGATALHH